MDCKRLSPMHPSLHLGSKYELFQPKPNRNSKSHPSPYSKIAFKINSPVRSIFNDVERSRFRFGKETRRKDLRNISNYSSLGSTVTSSSTINSLINSFSPDEIRLFRMKLLEDGFVILKSVMNENEVQGLFKKETVKDAKNIEDGHEAPSVFHPLLSFLIDTEVQNPSSSPIFQDLKVEKRFLFNSASFPIPYAPAPEPSSHPFSQFPPLSYPYWDCSWQIDGSEISVGEKNSFSSVLMNSSLLNIVISASSSKSNVDDSLYLYPRSHWLTFDFLRKLNPSMLHSPFPSSPLQLPSSPPQKIELDSGDVLIFHPWVTYSSSLDPNCSIDPSNFLLLRFLHNSESLSSKYEFWSGFFTSESEHISILQQQYKRIKNELLEEEEVARSGEWASSSPSLLSSSPPSILLNLDSVATLSSEFDSISNVESNESSLRIEFSFVHPKDELVWLLSSKVTQLLQAENYAECIPFFFRLSGLRPFSFWVFYEAGRCLTLSPCKGQLKGRAGRKCLLEDGERFLSKAMQMFPNWPPTYHILAQNLVEMGRGRENEVPHLFQSMIKIPNLDILCLAYPEALKAVEGLSQITHRLITSKKP